MAEYVVQGCRVEARKIVDFNIYHLSGDMGFSWTPQGWYGGYAGGTFSTEVCKEELSKLDLCDIVCNSVNLDESLRDQVLDICLSPDKKYWDLNAEKKSYSKSSVPVEPPSFLNILRIILILSIPIALFVLSLLIKHFFGHML